MTIELPEPGDQETYDRYNDPNWSEFGKGFLYPLSLFMCHAGILNADLCRLKEGGDKYKGIDGTWLWLNAAADHFFGFNPNAAPTAHLRKLATQIRDTALKYRSAISNDDRMTDEQAFQLIEDAKELMFELDVWLEHKPVKAEWS